MYFIKKAISMGATTERETLARYLEVWTRGVAFHDGKDKAGAVPCDQQLVRLVLGENGQRSAASFEALHVFRIGLRRWVYGERRAGVAFSDACRLLLRCAERRPEETRRRGSDHA